MKEFDERFSVPTKVPTPDLSSSEESTPSLCRAWHPRWGKQATRGGRKLWRNRSLRYELESVPYRTNLAQTSYHSPSTTYPTANVPFPKGFDEEFEEAVDSVQDLHIRTQPDYYRTNESLEDVMNYGSKKTAERVQETAVDGHTTSTHLLVRDGQGERFF